MRGGGVRRRGVRLRLLGTRRASKLEVATFLAEQCFQELRSKVPKKPVRSALGWTTREKYWLHMFYALAAARAAQAARPLRTGSYNRP
jgi:hypothetical protein